VKEKTAEKRACLVTVTSVFVLWDISFSESHWTYQS